MFRFDYFLWTEWCHTVSKGKSHQHPRPYVFSFEFSSNALLTSISYSNIPNVHQSTAQEWPHPLMISGDMYSEASFHVNVDIFRIKRASPDVFIPSVPTKLFVLKCAIQVLVSIAGGYGRNKRNNWLIFRYAWWHRWKRFTYGIRWIWLDDGGVMSGYSFFG